MRLPVALLSVVAVPASVLAAPVATLPAAAAQAVAPRVSELELPVVADGVEGQGVQASAAGARRTVAASGQESTAPFTTLGVTWRSEPGTGEVSVQVRTRTAGSWTPWTTIEAEEPEVLNGTPDATRSGVRAGTEPLFAGRSDGVQVRVDVTGGAAPADVEVALIDPGTSPADAAPATPLSTADAATAQPAIRSRAQWGADESIRKGSPSYASTLSAVTLHHTASSNEYTAADVPALIRGFYAYHVKSLGWSDIGYNVIVDKFGTAWEGRAGGLDKPVIGAHAGGFNTNTAGISLIGTYETVEPTAASKETVAQVAAWKLGLHGRDPLSSVTLTSAGSTRYPSGTQVTLPRIFGHRDVSSTACPGARGQATLPGLRTRAAALQDSTAVEPEPSPSPTTSPPPSPSPSPSPSPQPASKPFGALDEVSPRGGEVRVAGWAIDPDATTHTTVAVDVDGAQAGTTVADRSRPDLATAYPQYSTDHGFEAVFRAPEGRREICVRALDQGGSDDLLLGCRTVEVLSPDPVGLLESSRATGDVVGLRAAGWAYDPGVTSSSSVVLSVDGEPVRTVVADQSRPDVALALSVTAQRGFNLILPAAPGRREVCAVAVNQGLGKDAPLGCVTTDVPERPAPVSPPGARAVDHSCPTGSVPDGGFTDTASSVHRPAIDCAVWWQLTGGLTADSYGPEQKLSRGQVASFLARLLSSAGAVLPPAPADAFDDDRGSPHELAINQMAALGVVAGRGARRYEPGTTVSRDQMASYLVRTYEKHVGAPLPDGGQWYVDDDGSVHEVNIARAARAGFTGGIGPERYAPLAPTDRGQVASFLSRVLDMMVEHGRAPAHR